ncbi:Flotillin-1 [Labeo rohita]|uniref:Flotillin n=1 Tax=Labeo rohita TaxID=84645 RepID=A0ABQ8LY27_LABRO|nr:Flotillin-1 [Labeo rohita]
MFYTCGPNEAMVVSGCGRSPPLLIAGGRVFVFPCIQQIQRCVLNYNNRRISRTSSAISVQSHSDKVYTRHGVPISVTGIAQVKIQGQNKEMLATACQMFMGKSESEIAQIALETLEGHQRAIIAHLTVEEIYQDRKKFSEQVFKVASSDLVNMGIGVVSYTLKDNYLSSLGKARTAQVQKDARIGEAQFKRDAVIREAHAMQEKVSAQYKNEIEMAKAQRDFELKKAAYDIEVNTKKAESEMAYQLQVAKTKQRIEEEKMQVQVVERTQQITLQEQEITRREKELEAKVRKPAEAERYRIEKIAEAERLQLIMEAEAEAESIRMRGEAEAFALEAKGRAEAEQMAKKAEAFKQYKEGAMVDMLLEKLPLMAEEISKPLCAAQKVTMVSSGGSEVGAAKLTGEVLDIMTRLPSTVEKLTGVNISQVTALTSAIKSL